MTNALVDEKQDIPVVEHIVRAFHMDLLVLIRNPFTEKYGRRILTALFITLTFIIMYTRRRTL